MVKETISWGSALVDIAILAFAFAVAFWQDNTNFLWLICLTFFTGSYKLNGKTQSD